MGWLLLTCGVVGAGVAGLLRHIQRLQELDTPDDTAHYAISMRFWTLLAAMGLILPIMLLAPLAGWGMFKTFAAQLAAVLAMIPPLVLVGVGSGNALALRGAMQRRQRALKSGEVVEGIVTDRYRRLVGQDLFVVEVEAEVPDPDPGLQDSYRPTVENPTIRKRFTELVPAEQWNRFEPGMRVQVAIDSVEAESCAVILGGDATALPEGDAPKALPSA